MDKNTLAQSNTPCLVESCPKPKDRRGWCTKHYMQWLRHGDPEWKDKKQPNCSIQGCDRKRLSRRMCNLHYQRWRKYGDASTNRSNLGLSVEDRFWMKVEKKGPHDCWLWTGATDKDGYGIFGIEGARGAKASRISYEWEYGTIRPKAQVLHRCDVSACVNPRHLYSGTPMDNMQDKIVRGRARYLRGSECRHAKLTERKVRNIRKLYSNGMSYSEIAQKYGVTRSNIEQIVARKTWQHI